nr:MAG: hypothetical protein DiTV3a_F1ORF4 [Diabrotica toursvirus 3a]
MDFLLWLLEYIPKNILRYLTEPEHFTLFNIYGYDYVHLLLVEKKYSSVNYILQKVNINRCPDRILKELPDVCWDSIIINNRMTDKFVKKWRNQVVYSHDDHYDYYDNYFESDEYLLLKERNEED